MPDALSENNQNRIWIISCLVLCLFISFYQNYLIEQFSALPDMEYSISAEPFRAMDFGDGKIDAVFRYATEENVNPYELMTVLMIQNNFSLKNVKLSSVSKTSFIRYRNRLVRKYPNQFQELRQGYENIFTGLSYFPVPKSNEKKRKWINYVNSWGYERTYGGNRRHEGTDIMAGENERGVYPLLAVAAGKIVHKGWLEKGGYRIGIRTDTGAYLYYAHMASYAEGIQEGDSVYAGEFLGYMGDTGYSVVEGTTGKFDVHLHFGIYLNEDTDEISVNPYYILKYLENNTLNYKY